MIKINNKKYGLGKFMVDMLLTWITGGFWLLWVIFRFIRNNDETKNY